MFLACLGATAALVTGPQSAIAQPPAAYRAFWVDTFNTALNTSANVTTVVNNAKAANVNALLVQVRRRGESWYINSLEPIFQFVTPGFDPLQDLINKAHAEGIEVHAYVIANAIWSGRFTSGPNNGRVMPPPYPNHMFHTHAGYDPLTDTVTPGPENWLTRTLLPDTPLPANLNINYQGHRLGGEFYIDPGHPNAAEYTVNVLTHLVRNYDVDGLHLDRIRYPEINVTGQTSTTGANIGYNPTNVARFQRRFGIPEGSVPPIPGNADWAQWRRDQVTNLVRRIYLNAIAIKPLIKVSASLIVFGAGPTTEGLWRFTEPYWRVYQDWRAWTEEGILDIAIPMDYKQEHLPAVRPQFDQWAEWTKNHQYDRSALIGIAGNLNAIEGTLRQIRHSGAPSAAGNSVPGVSLFSMANTNAAVTANPFSIPPNLNTPLRSFAEFVSGLTTGKSVNGLTLYEPVTVPYTPVFAGIAPIPAMPWKTSPSTGHVKGFIRDEDGSIVDAGAVTIFRADGTSPGDGRTIITTATDGGGFYGGVDLVPGVYRVTVMPTGKPSWTTVQTFEVIAGTVTDFDFRIDRAGPTGSMTTDSKELWPPNGKMIPITLTGSAADSVTGLRSVTFEVIDEYATVQPAIESITADGAASLTWTRTFGLEADRRGKDKDGRQYVIKATLTDVAGNVTIVTTNVVVLHDRRDHDKDIEVEATIVDEDEDTSIT